VTSAEASKESFRKDPSSHNIISPQNDLVSNWNFAYYIKNQEGFMLSTKR
jgi:hypothetical protein